MKAEMRALLAQRLEEEGMPSEIPISVAELHRRLLPYPLCRDRLGFAGKAEYDIGFLRLLVDDRSLHVQERALRDAVKQELDSPEPGLALLQRFAASEVRLRTLRGDRDEDEAAPVQEEEPPAETGPPIAELETGRSRGDHLPGLDDPLLVPQDESADALGQAPSGNRSSSGDAGPAGETASASEAASPGPCRSCGVPLPGRPGLRFCPRCGADQERWPCPACGEEVERGWSYCALCGRMLPT